MDHTQKDIEFHTAIALSSKNVVVPRLIPVINSSIPLFVESTSGALHEETIETHREIAAAIAEHDALRAQDAMYLHLVYNRKRILLTEKFLICRTASGKDAVRSSRSLSSRSSASTFL